MKLWAEHDSGMSKLEVSALILTFDIGTDFLHATYCLVTMTISAKLFSNPTTHDEFMGQT